MTVMQRQAFECLAYNIPKMEKEDSMALVESGKKGKMILVYGGIYQAHHVKYTKNINSHLTTYYDKGRPGDFLHLLLSGCIGRDDTV